MITLSDCQQTGNNLSAGDNFVNPKHAKSVSRDALFWPAFLGVWAGGAGHRSPDTSVKSHSRSHPAPTPLPSNSSPSTLETVDADLAALFPVERRVAERFDDYMRRQPRAPHFKHHKPAQWRALALPMRSLYFHRALASQGPVHAFTLRLSKDVEAEAKLDASAATWLYKRIARRLSGELHRPVTFWFVIEAAQTGGRGLHLHGELQITGKEAEAARKALRLAGGEWPAVRQHQAHTRADPDEGWLSYVLKHDAFTAKPSRRGGPIAATIDQQRGFKGANFAASRALRGEALASYERDRKAHSAGPCCRFLAN